jgi:hypothetical protein
MAEGTGPDPGVDSEKRPGLRGGRGGDQRKADGMVQLRTRGRILINYLI